MDRRAFLSGVGGFALGWPALSSASADLRAPLHEPAAPAVLPLREPPASELERRIDEAFVATFPVYEMARSRFNAVAHPRNPARQPPNGGIIHRRELIDHTARQVTTPNNDTLYSAGWLDLHAGPVRVRLPAVDRHRYWSVALLDAWTENFAVVGRRTEGGGPLDVTVVGPDWKGAPPPGRVIRAPGNDVWLLGRFLVDGAADANAVHRLQDGLRIEPVVPHSTPRPQQVTPTVSTDPANFMAVVNEFLARNPVAAGDAARLQSWRELGIGEGALPFEATSAEVQAAWRRRLPVLHEALAIGLGYGARTVDGWAVPSSRVGRFEGDEALRAAVALGGLGALPPEEAIYLTLESAPDGAVLSGSRRWKLLVPPIETQAFWSLSMYQKEPDSRLFFAANPIGRHSIGDRTSGLRRRADGWLELQLQHELPPDTSHWLPMPPGDSALVLRVYLPSTAMRRGEAPLPRLVPVD